MLPASVGRLLEVWVRGGGGGGCFLCFVFLGAFPLRGSSNRGLSLLLPKGRGNSCPLPPVVAVEEATPPVCRGGGPESVLFSPSGKNVLSKPSRSPPEAGCRVKGDSALLLPAAVLDGASCGPVGC